VSVQIRVSAHSVCNALGQDWSRFWSAFTRGERGLERSLPAALPCPSFEHYTGAVRELLRAPHPELVDTRQARLAWAAIEGVRTALQACQQRWGSDRIGLLLGTSTGGLQSSEHAIATLNRTGALPLDYSCRDGHAFDAVTRQLAKALHLGGPSAVVSTACSSSTKALAAGKRWLENGIVDAVLVGGVDSLCSLTLMGFASLGILASEPCRPFSERLVGMNVAEGAAWLLLERGAGPVMLLGSGESSDAFQMVAPDPTGTGTRRAIELALQSSGLNSATVGYINAHATGTAANDPVEARVLTELFAHAHVETSKAQTGHQLGAAGATQAAICVGRLTQEVPLHTKDGVPVEVALMNTLAFGGANATLIFGRGPRESSSQATSPQTTALHAQVERVTLWAPGHGQTALLSSGPGAAGARPEAKLLATRERGRASLLTLMFAECLGGLAEPEALSLLPVVYGSAFGPVHTTLELLEQQGRGECSPLRFQASVHNAPAGILSASTRNREFYTSVAGGEHTVAVALLEALCWLHSNPGAPKIAVLVGDEAPPRPLLAEDYQPMSAGFLLSRAGDGLGQIRWRASFVSEPESVAELSLRHGSDAALRGNPCGSALRVLDALQQGASTTLPLTGEPRGPVIEVVSRAIDRVALKP
jgi:3-oxoacyl-[acyl-carrier-protein] synthase-1